MLSALQGMIEVDAAKDLMWEGVPCVLMDLDSGEILLINRAAEQLYGYAMPGELIGLPIEQLIPPRLRERHVEHRVRYAATPTQRAMGEGYQLTGQHRDGHEFPVLVALYPKVIGSGAMRRRCTLAVLTPLTVHHPTTTP